MQSRISFNAGEFSPDLATRSDIEYYFKACSCLENWDVSQMGGLKRRKGMRHFAKAMTANSKLIPYIYSYEEGAGLRFLIEVGEEKIKVWGEDGELVRAFQSGVNAPEFSIDTSRVWHKQINAMLIITCQENMPLVLESKDAASWELKEFEFKHYPWRYNHEERDYPITLTTENGGSVFFEAEEDIEETIYDKGDIMRASYWVEQAEAHESSSTLRAGVTITASVPNTAKAGDKFAIQGEMVTKYYTALKGEDEGGKFTKEALVSGLDLPVNYPSAFTEVDDRTGCDGLTAYAGLSEYFEKTGETEIDKGTKIAVTYGYWEYWTCIKDFDKGASERFEDYPQSFIHGIAVGDALPCKGSWVFFCSGAWFGSYEVRRNYTEKELNDKWESRGVSFSRNESASNLQISGSEEDEECYLRLFLTRSRYADGTLEDGFPPDSCGNRLVVSTYKHDSILQVKEVGDILYFDEVNDVKIPMAESRTITDWSWMAFSKRYGYPLICETFNKRLIFTSTKNQPQTMWFSRIDDIDNFLTGKTDDAAIALTLLTTTQNPICWLKPRGNRIMLGTSEAEYIVSALQANNFTSSTATAVDHGYVGSAAIAVVGVNDKMLYVERGAGRVWTFEYSLEIDGWRSTDLTIFAPHIAEKHGGFVRSSVIKKPDAVAMFVLGDGQLALCTYNSLHEVKAWHRWTTDGFIREVCGMPNGNAADRVFLVVERNGTSFIEVVDEQSDYTDGGRDYTSTMITLPFHNPMQEIVKKNHSTQITAFIAEPFNLKADNVTVSLDEQEWFASDMWDGEVTRGWHPFIAPRNWNYSYSVGVKVKGNQAFNILALQG